MSSVSFRMRPRRTFSATITPNVTIPSATPTPVTSGTPKRSPQTTALVNTRSASWETRVSRTSQRAFRRRFRPPWFSVATVSRASAQMPR